MFKIVFAVLLTLGHTHAHFTITPKDTFYWEDDCTDELDDAAHAIAASLKSRLKPHVKYQIIGGCVQRDEI